MNLKRVLSGVIGFPIVVAILVLGNKYVIDIVFALVILISMYEYFNATSKKYKPLKFLGYIFSVLVAFIHIIPVDYILKLLIMFIPIIIAILFIKVIISKMETNFNDISTTLFGLLYVIGFAVFIPVLYAENNGKFLVWYIFLAAWGTDTFAYISGKLFGKHKLSRISPKKTVEGSLGGIIGATFLGIIYTVIINNFIQTDINYIYIFIVLIALSILSQIGDLAASSIKRYVDIKDFGNLIPGHGGMLDRIDSIIFIAPFAYFLLSIL